MPDLLSNDSKKIIIANVNYFFNEKISGKVTQVVCFLATRLNFLVIVSLCIGYTGVPRM